MTIGRPWQGYDVNQPFRKVWYACLIYKFMALFRALLFRWDYTRCLQTLTFVSSSTISAFTKANWRPLVWGYRCTLELWFLIHISVFLTTRDTSRWDSNIITLRFFTSKVFLSLCSDLFVAGVNNRQRCWVIPDDGEFTNDTMGQKNA